MGEVANEPRDRITELRVKGLRTLADVRLRLSGLTVLIGDNGSGKSSILEACEILRLAPEGRFVEKLSGVHQFPGNLLRLGATSLSLGVTIEGRGQAIDYDVTISFDARSVAIESEVLAAHVGPAGGSGRLRVIHRDREGCKILDGGAPKDLPILNRADLSLSWFGVYFPHPYIERVSRCLLEIDVQLAFDATSTWAARKTGRPVPTRTGSLFAPTTSLQLFASNLASAYHSLKNDFGEEHWRATMDRVRLGLGSDVESVSVRAEAGGGNGALWLVYEGRTDGVPASALSDGTFAYLAFVAVYRLPRTLSLLAIDEPESHLHPELAVRVLLMLESMSRDVPVLVATHSDRLLDALEDPSKSVVLCELDERRATRLVRPDPDALASWLEKYRGLGDVRAAGYEPFVMTRPEPRS